jgi:hypothetical protein
MILLLRLPENFKGEIEFVAAWKGVVLTPSEALEAHSDPYTKVSGLPPPPTPAPIVTLSPTLAPTTLAPTGAPTYPVGTLNPTYVWANPGGTVFSGNDGITLTVPSGQLPKGDATNSDSFTLMVQFKPASNYPAPGCGGSCGSATLVEIGEGTFNSAGPFFGIRIEPMTDPNRANYQFRIQTQSGALQMMGTTNEEMFNSYFTSPPSWNTMTFTWNTGGSGNTGSATFYKNGVAYGTQNMQGPYSSDDTIIKIARKF